MAREAEKLAFGRVVVDVLPVAWQGDAGVAVVVGSVFVVDVLDLPVGAVGALFERDGAERDDGGCAERGAARLREARHVNAAGDGEAVNLDLRESALWGVECLAGGGGDLHAGGVSAYHSPREFRFGVILGEGLRAEKERAAALWGAHHECDGGGSVHEKFGHYVRVVASGAIESYGE